MINNSNIVEKTKDEVEKIIDNIENNTEIRIDMKHIGISQKLFNTTRINAEKDSNKMEEFFNKIGFKFEIENLNDNDKIGCNIRNDDIKYPLKITDTKDFLIKK